MQDKMVMKWPPKYGRIYDHKGWTTNWHLLKALPTSEQQRHWLSSSVETELRAAAAVDLQHPLREFRVE